MKRLLFSALLAGVASLAPGAIILQEDATPGQVGTQPASLLASFDGAADVQVVTLATMSPTIGADHAGGDGHVLRVGDIGAGGGSFNWAYEAAGTPQTDVAVSAWVFVEWTTRDGTPLERDYLIIARKQTAANPQSAPARNGYMLAITADSSWGGISPNPPNFKPFIMKRSGTNTTLLSSYGVADVTDGWHQVRLEVIGTQIRGYVDGVQVVSATDSEFASGFAGWGYYDDNGSATFPYAAAYDNLLYETITAFTAVDDWSMFN